MERSMVAAMHIILLLFVHDVWIFFFIRFSSAVALNVASLSWHTTVVAILCAASLFFRSLFSVITRCATSIAVVAVVVVSVVHHLPFWFAVALHLAWGPPLLDTEKWFRGLVHNRQHTNNRQFIFVYGIKLTANRCTHTHTASKSVSAVWARALPPNKVCHLVLSRKIVVKANVCACGMANWLVFRFSLIFFLLN